MRKPRAPKIRAKFHEIISKMPSAGMETIDAVKLLRKHHPNLIAEELNDIIEIGLMRFAGEAFSRRSSAIMAAHPNLFGEYGAPPIIKVRLETKKGPRNVNKNLDKATVEEASTFADRKRRPSPPVTEEIKELLRLIEFVRERGAKESDNLFEAWEIARESA
jgi:hypothetical protein